MTERRLTLEEHDVTGLIGLRVIVVNTAREIVDEDDEVSIEIPDIAALSCAAAVARCLLPIRLQGNELRTIRHIVGWTATELAAKMGDRTSPETISRWENDKQTMGGYAEKVFRLVVCEELASKAPGVNYKAGSIANLVVTDPWRGDSEFVVPTLICERVRIKIEHEIVETWECDEQKKLAA